APGEKNPAHARTRSTSSPFKFIPELLSFDDADGAQASDAARHAGVFDDFDHFIDVLIGEGGLFGQSGFALRAGDDAFLFEGIAQIDLLAEDLLLRLVARHATA